MAQRIPRPVLPDYEKLQGSLTTNHRCLPCLMQKVSDLLDLYDIEETVKYLLISKVPRIFEEAPEGALSAHILREVYDLLRQQRGGDETIKTFQYQRQILNDSLLQERTQLKNRIRFAKRPIAEAIRLATIASTYATRYTANPHPHLLLADEELSPHAENILLEQLSTTANVVIIGNQAGEIVADQLLATKLRVAHLTYITRDEGFGLSVSTHDAKYVGMDSHADILPDGCRAHVFIPEYANTTVLNRIKEASIVIVKGMANYEAMMQMHLPNAYALLRADCAAIASAFRVPIGKPLIIPAWRPKIHN